MIRSGSALASLTALILFVAGGCGSSTSVSGSATYDGAPIANGVISLFATDGVGPTAAAPIVAGSFHIENVAPGSKTVVIERFEEIPFTPSSEQPPPQPAKPAGGQSRTAGAGQSAAIPRNAQGNGATVEVHAGTQTLDFHLTAPAQPPTGARTPSHR